MNMERPCKGCEKRESGCQDTCPELFTYNFFQKQKQRELEEIKKDYQKLNKGTRKSKVKGGSGYHRKGFVR